MNGHKIPLSKVVEPNTMDDRYQSKTQCDTRYINNC